VGTCKLPTQQFFNLDMGVPMRMLPNYETFEVKSGKRPMRGGFGGGRNSKVFRFVLCTDISSTHIDALVCLMQPCLAVCALLVRLRVWKRPHARGRSRSGGGDVLRGVPFQGRRPQAEAMHGTAGAVTKRFSFRVASSYEHGAPGN
jgi:hypothetical protein